MAFIGGSLIFAGVAVGSGASVPEKGNIAVVAHRGFSYVAPENTLASVRKAIEVGADGCEFDVYRCGSGELVLFHDKDLKRTTGGIGIITETGFDDLQKLDVGSWKSPVYCGERIPTLRDALQLLKSSGCRAVIEIKTDGITDQVLQTVRDEKMSGQVAIIAFSGNVIRELHDLAPDLPCAWLYSNDKLEGSSDHKADVIAEKARSCKAQVVNLNQQMLDEALIRALHARGLSVWTWTVDDPVRMRQLCEWGVDVLTTNRPDLAMSVRKGTE